MSYQNDPSQRPSAQSRILLMVIGILGILLALVMTEILKAFKHWS